LPHLKKQSGIFLHKYLRTANCVVWRAVIGDRQAEVQGVNAETIVMKAVSASRQWFYWAALFLIAGEFLLVRALLLHSSPASAGSQQQRAAYEKAWSAYRKAQDAFEAEAYRYWQLVHVQQGVRRKKRAAGQAVAETDYVLHQPPIYAGPPAPAVPSFMVAEQAKAREGLQGAIVSAPTPVVADFLAAAKAQYGFVPHPTGENDYMLAFAREALHAGLSAEQVVGVYSLETGGLGPYSRQSGIFTVNNLCQPVPAHGTPASSLALGYVQLLPANTVATARDRAEAVSGHLMEMAEKAAKERSVELRSKAEVFKHMVDDVNKWSAAYTGSKDNWQEYVVYGRTKNGLAMHALLLDADIGPSLQVYKLLGITAFAARHGLTGLTSSKLELINLVGDGRGVEALTPAAKNAAAANFFDRSGYERNPIAKGQTAGSLLAKLEATIARRKQECGSKRFFEAFEAGAK
jgi:hypothetical protein